MQGKEAEAEVGRGNLKSIYLNETESFKMHYLNWKPVL